MSAKKTLKDVINHAKNIRVAPGTGKDVRALAAEIEKLAGAVLQLERDRTPHLPPAVAEVSGPTEGRDEAAAALPPWRPGAAA
jgi:hypothetical protein